MTAGALHITFSVPAAECLCEALAQAGRNDRAIGCPDDLSLGPIEPLDSERRARWSATELGPGWEDVRAQSDAFWQTALSSQDRRVVWLSRRSTLEYCGFLEFIWQLGDAPCDVVDLTDFMIRHRDAEGELSAQRLAGCTGFIPAATFVETGLLDHAEPLTTAMREACRTLWAQLRNENTALRVLDADLRLHSAPISFFDTLLLTHARPEWRKVARVIADTLFTFWDESRYNGHDLLLASRVRSLVADGRLEGAGDLFQIRHSEVRLPLGRSETAR